MPEIDYPPFFSIIRRFYELDVKYIVIGGVAAVLHGVLRVTFDLDVVIEFSKENITKLTTVLKEFNLRPTVPIEIEDFVNDTKRKEWVEKKNARVINFSDADGIYRLDIALIYNYSDIKPMQIIIDDVLVYLVDKKTLIDMKKNAGRDIDMRDIQYLQGL